MDTSDTTSQGPDVAVSFPSTDELPPELAQLLDGLHPAVRAFIEHLVAQVAAHEHRIEALLLRIGVTEAKVDDYLQDGHHAAQAHAPEQQRALATHIGTPEHGRSTAPPRTAVRTNAAVAAPARPAQAVPVPRLSVVDKDALRLRLLRAHQRGKDSFVRERTTIMREHRLNGAQMNATWARCQGKHAPDFAGRMLRNTPNTEGGRVRMRDELAKLLDVSRDQIIAWYKLRNGNGSTPHETASTPRTRTTRTR
jgi:hypothetical protein